MRKIAVVGCGWLGYPLALSLLEKGFSVIGTTTSPEKITLLAESGIEPRVWSIANLSDTDLDFLHSVNLIILNIPPSKNDASVTYSKALKSICSRLNKNTKVIFISTTSVYPDTLSVAEENYCWSESDLKKETVLAEIALQEILNDRLTILRFAGLIGNNRHPVRFLAGKTNLENGNSPVNLIHLTDSIGLIEQVILTETWGEIFNGCYPDHPSRETYYSEKAKTLNLEPPKFARNSSTSKIVDSEKSMRLLGYTYKAKI